MVTPPCDEVAGKPSAPEGEGVLEGLMVIPPPPSTNVLVDLSSSAFGPSAVVAPGHVAPSPSAPLKPRWEGLTEDQ
ncbi:hypothetical protein BHE74_00039852 [Ensete ventricosum]|nr:hypothetical protein GW17_00044642 [Ensete ventricosum]RWW53643.1 hypothetical protein BHE74_00039852 [Ensete ventricosum]RZR84396.1 hypothetical protein BHM03_00011228 [Ensete ventricosum]